MIARNPAFDERPYTVRGVRFALEGEGARAGSAGVYLVFSGCNLQCSIPAEGFNCLVDFQHGEKRSVEEILELVRHADRSPKGCGWVVATGGEPTIQFDQRLRDALRGAGYRVAIETNGTRAFKASVDYVVVSPKPRHPCILQHANECRVVLRAGQNPDEAQLAMASRSSILFVSPAARAPDAARIREWNSEPKRYADVVDEDAVAWCLDFVSQNPRFRFSFQSDKVHGAR